jgi:hypothetical protein
MSRAYDVVVRRAGYREWQRARIDVAIEKVFAIHAQPSDIYAALQRDLGSASQHEGDVFEVLRRERDRLIELRVKIGGVPCFLTYTIEQKPEYCEVTASMVPFGWQWALFNIATFGMRRGNFELMLAQGLVNLKEEVEFDTEADGVLGEEDAPDGG